jgi:hypothetical protein
MDFYRCINCIAVIAPKKKTVGTAKPWIANQRTVKIGYVSASAAFLLVMSFDFNKNDW